MKKWFYSGSSVVGQSHQNTSTPCQDKFQVQTSDDGEWLAIAVSDGAGSAEFAELGASLTSTHFCNELIKLSKDLSTRPPGGWINDFVIDCVIKVREQLRNAARSDDIRKYHCTLVAALIGKSGGFSIHIGDGAVLGGTFQTILPGTYELNSSYFISKPENGEYSNETYFITEGNWVKHLRITPLPALDWLIVCTDGGASLLLDNENEVKPTFVAPFIEAQINDGFHDNQYIESILNNPKANKLTTDDKTIVLAVRNDVIKPTVKLQFSLSKKSVNPTVTTSSMAIPTPVQNSTQRPLASTDSLATKSAAVSQKKTSGEGKKNSQVQANSRKKLIFCLSLLLIFGIAVTVGAFYGKDYIQNIDDKLFKPKSEKSIPSPTQAQEQMTPVMPQETSSEPAKNSEKTHETSGH